MNDKPVTAGSNDDKYSKDNALIRDLFKREGFEIRNDLYYNNTTFDIKWDTGQWINIAKKDITPERTFKDKKSAF